MSHGAPILFITTLLLMNNYNKENLLIKYGIYLSIIIALCMISLYYLLNCNKYIAIIFTIILWIIMIYIYLQNV